MSRIGSGKGGRIGLVAAVAAALLAGLLAASCGRVDRSRSVVLWEQMDPEEQKLFDRHLEEFRAAHPEYAGFDIHRFHYRTEDLRTQFQTAALAYGGPNLVYGPGDNIGPFSIMGLLLPLEDLLAPEEIARFDPASLPVLGGHVYGLPAHVGNHLALVANLALVDTVPADTDAWLAQLRALTRDEDGDGRPESYGLVYNMIEPFWLVPWLGGFGGWVMDEANRPTLDDPAMARALDFLRGLGEAGVVPRECDYPLADTLFKEGRAAYIINGNWSWQGYRAAGLDIAVWPLPRVAATGRWPTPMTNTKGYSVNRYLHPATADCTRDLLLFLTSRRAQVELALALGVMPSDLSAREDPEVVGDALQAASMAQLEKGRLMPIVPEMRFVWDAMRPYYQNVCNLRMDGAEAARRMQGEAERLLRENTE